ncbi:MAG: rhomboid family intramembrane serine protease [Geobacter sp.]|nr:rhomboid family intramembrane serine protease [Geobacter sp.]
MEDDLSQNEMAAEPWVNIEARLINPNLPEILGKEQARLWSLVLDARGVPCCLENRHQGRWQLLVPREELARAEWELAAYEEKNRSWPPLQPPPRPMVENTLATLSILILLATFHNLVRLDMVLPGGIRPDWLAAGSARAELILAGDWWRIVTALTLHRDVAHLLGNLGIGGMFVFLLCRELGSGLSWSLILTAGALGNLINALLQPGSHDSVGASTAVFGTVGILAALSSVRYRHTLRKRWGLPVAAALALLVLLGTEGKNTDLGAHFFGFISGSIIGLITEMVIARRGHPSALLNALLAICAGLVVAVSWLTALALA